MGQPRLNQPAPPALQCPLRPESGQTVGAHPAITGHVRTGCCSPSAPPESPRPLNLQRSNADFASALTFRVVSSRLRGFMQATSAHPTKQTFFRAMREVAVGPTAEVAVAAYSIRSSAKQERLRAGVSFRKPCLAQALEILLQCRLKGKLGLIDRFSHPPARTRNSSTVARS